MQFLVNIFDIEWTMNIVQCTRHVSTFSKPWFAYKMSATSTNAINCFHIFFNRHSNLFSFISLVCVVCRVGKHQYILCPTHSLSLSAAFTSESFEFESMMLKERHYSFEIHKYILFLRMMAAGKVNEIWNMERGDRLWIK